MSHNGAARRLSDVLEGRESIDLDLPIQVPSRPATPPQPHSAAPLVPIIDMNTGAMDEEVERYLISQAHRIGAEIPPQPGSRKLSDEMEVASANVSALTVSTQDENTIPSRTSQSTQPTSCNSSIKNDSLQPPQAQQQVRPSRSFRRAPSSSGASVAESTSSNSSRFMKSFRRLSSFSSFSKKRTSVIGSSNPQSVRPSVDSISRDIPEIQRPTTADGLDMPDSTAISGTKTFSTRSRTLNRTPSTISRASSVGAVSLPPMGTSYSSISGRQERVAAAAERAKRRTLQSPRLQSLRLRQIDEQTQFLDYHTSLLESMRSRFDKESRALQAAYEESRERLEDSHAQVHASLEDRHLAAEMELTRTLQQERQACDTKLKHMDAYCNGRLSVIDGKTPPRRKVTDEDYRKLVQQYQIRQGMDNLHDSRIGVLRKKQAKQIERISQRQQVECDTLHKDLETERRRKQAASGREADELRADFSSKLERLQWRWKLMETVERKKLETETGLAYGEMPEMQWGEHELIKSAV